MRVEHRGTVLLAGAMLAGLVLVPVLNLLTPLFGVALMVHVHKRLAARALPDRAARTPAPAGGRSPARLIGARAASGVAPKSGVAR